MRAGVLGGAVSSGARPARVSFVGAEVRSKFRPYRKGTLRGDRTTVGGAPLPRYLLGVPEALVKCGWYQLYSCYARLVWGLVYGASFSAIRRT